MAFIHQKPFLNPRVPFKGCIEGGLLEGKVITVTGRVMPAADRFHVNMQCGLGQLGDTAFHFNPRYERLPGYVVCNTLQHYSWGKEERKYEAPIPRGANFTLTLLVNRDTYSVIINGSHFLDYCHRLPISCVDTISVDGGVEINSISFQNPPMPTQKFSAASYYKAPPPYTPTASCVMPYTAAIPGGMFPGRSVFIVGVTNPSAHSFAFNLRFTCGIAFHFNPRFRKGLVVRNSFLNERWGHEERTGGLPFYPGQSFLVTLTCDTECYRVLLSGIQIFTYQHRHKPLQEVDILEVTGDVTLTSVLF